MGGRSDAVLGRPDKVVGVVDVVDVAAGSGAMTTDGLASRPDIEDERVFFFVLFCFLFLSLPLPPRRPP